MSTKSHNPTVLVLGGDGAQNGAIIKVLSAAGTFNITLLTRSVAAAAETGSLPNVKLIEGSCYDEDTLVSAFKDVDFCFINTNGFAIGEKNEIYWGIRMYEIARWAGVKHFVYSSLPYVSKNGDFDPKRRVPFVDGKAKVARTSQFPPIPPLKPSNPSLTNFLEFLASMPLKPMPWTVIGSGPYAERLFDNAVPTVDADGTYVFGLPLGPTGAMPLVSLEDFGWYVQWAFENPSRSAGLDFGIAIAHVTGADHAAAFTAVTGKPARYEDVPLQAVLNSMPQGKIGSKASPGYDDPTLMTAAGHFGPWWGIFRDSGKEGNTGCWARDYGLLDEIFPGRIKTLEEWMRRAGYTGQPKAVLKTALSLHPEA